MDDDGTVDHHKRECRINLVRMNAQSLENHLMRMTADHEENYLVKIRRGSELGESLGANDS